MKLIVGLGNIGKEYEGTNHNAGFMVIDSVAEKLGVKFGNRSCDADWGTYRSESDKFIFAKPRTYMNNSGRAIKAIMAKYDIAISDVLVICDDIDQMPGSIRMRKSGSAGTHNGLKSVIAETNSQDFIRLRVGIGQQAEHQDLVDFVLAKMRLSDEQKRGLNLAVAAVCDFVSGESVDTIMAKYNGNSSKNGKH